jgi:hypothetical protein
MPRDPNPNPPPQAGEGGRTADLAAIALFELIEVASRCCVEFFTRGLRRALPLPLAGEGGGGGLSAREIASVNTLLPPFP